MENTKQSNSNNKLYGSISFVYDTWFTFVQLSENAALRKKSVESLNLVEGDIVLDICCGTGLNFKILQNIIGKNGKIIGIDLAPEMIKNAKVRCEKNGWNNIDLITSDVLEFKTKTMGDCAISTAAIGIIPEYRKAVDIVMDNLKEGGRFVILDVKKSNRYPFRFFNYLFCKVTKIIGFDLNNRDLISYIKSKYVIEFYEENTSGFRYILTFRKP